MLACGGRAAEPDVVPAGEKGAGEKAGTEVESHTAGKSAVCQTREVRINRGHSRAKPDEIGSVLYNAGA